MTGIEPTMNEESSGKPLLKGRGVALRAPRETDKQERLAYGRDHLAAVERDRWFVEDPEALDQVAQRMAAEDPARSVWVLADRKAWERLPEIHRDAFEAVSRNRKMVLLKLR